MCLDYIYLGIAHALREPMLMTSFVIKASFIVIELGLIIVFRITEHIHYKQNNMAATLEWGEYLWSSLLFCLANSLDSYCIRVYWLHSFFDRRLDAVSSKEPPESKGVSAP